MNKNHERSSKQEENTAETGKGPPADKEQNWDKNSKFKSVKLHMLEQKEAPKEALHLSKKQNALIRCKTLSCS